MSWSTSPAGALLAGVVLLAACDGAEAPSPDEVLLDESDLAPLEPTYVGAADGRANSGTQHWGCADNDGVLLEQGWEIRLRDLRSTVDRWAVYSGVLDHAEVPADRALEEIEERVDDCRAEGSRLEDLDLGAGAYGYRSVTPQGQVDTVRAYGVAGDHRLVQVTVLGLEGEDAPDVVDRLLEAAVEKAGVEGS